MKVIIKINISRNHEMQHNLELCDCPVSGVCSVALY